MNTKSTVFICLLLATAVSVSNSRAQDAPAESDPPPAKPKNVELPGIQINRQEAYVDIKSKICLEQGMLELIACTPDTKEHESVVVVSARPMHIHAALLLLGVNNGNPAMMKCIDEENDRWIQVPPRGDPIDVSLVITDEQGKVTEHPISHFLCRGEQYPDVPFGNEAQQPESKETFPNTFLFAGSHIQVNEEGKRRYLADATGDIVSIASFGDEILCLPEIHSHANAALIWEINPKTIPKKGTEVQLRLRRHKKVGEKKEAPVAEPKTPEQNPKE